MPSGDQQRETSQARLLCIQSTGVLNGDTLDLGNKTLKFISAPNLHNGAYKYYFDVIMKPFSRFMTKAIEKIKLLEIDVICPGHGPIHRENRQKAINLSEDYAGKYLQLINQKDQYNILIAISLLMVIQNQQQNI